VSEKRPPTPARRPANARPRTAATDEHAHESDAPPPEPPSATERVAIERQMLELTELSGATVEPDPALRGLLVGRARRGPAFNYLGAIRWPASGWQAFVAVTEQRFRALGEWPCVIVADGLSTPPTIGADLERDGWLPLERETIMWTRRAAIVPHLDPWLRVEAVTAKSAPVHEQLEREVFELAESNADDRVDVLARGIQAGRLRAYLVRLHGEPVAVARLTARDGIAALYGIGVAEGARRQGLGRLITTVATRAALATGNRLVWLSVDESNATARHLYGALGFEPTFGWTRLLGPAS
jgi:ribosomal protein S18 acetylase RimI-like enzyme